MILDIIYTTGYIFRFITPTTHILGFALLCYTKTKHKVPKMILKHFSALAAIKSNLFSIRWIYSYLQKENVNKAG